MFEKSMKNKIKSSQPLFLAFVLSLGIACQQAVSEIQLNDSPKAVSLNAPENASAKSRALAGIDESINKDGWKLPSLSSFAVKSKKTVQLKIGESTVKVEQTEYKPVESVVIDANEYNYKDDPRRAYQPDPIYKIRFLRLFRAKDTPFCYLVRGDLTTADRGGTDNGILAPSVVLIYLDNDGDGTFEAFKYSSSESPPVPEWVGKELTEN